MGNRRPKAAASRRAEAPAPMNGRCVRWLPAIAGRRALDGFAERAYNLKGALVTSKGGGGS